jgi:hypothetical protein
MARALTGTCAARLRNCIAVVVSGPWPVRYGRGLLHSLHLLLASRTPPPARITDALHDSRAAARQKPSGSKCLIHAIAKTYY